VSTDRPGGAGPSSGPEPAASPGAALRPAPGGALEDARSLAAAVAAGRCSPREAVGAAIARIDAVDPVLNAVIHRRFERALDDADASPAGAFRGVPILLKDLGAAQAGEPLHAGLGVARRAGYRAESDAAVVGRLRGAGFVVLGRTNTPELGTTVTTEPVAYGPTRNPWGTGHSAGGSSGGSAAAVASGMVPVAHASDGGGSIRIPASACGLVGLKPTRGRVSRSPGGEGWMGGSTDGALARTVADAAAVLDVLAGPEPGDPYSAAPLARPLAAEVGVAPGRLRIGVLDHPPGGQRADPEAAAAVGTVAAVLADLGHDLPAAWPAALGEDEEYRSHFLRVVACGVATDLATWERRLGVAIDDDELEAPNAALRRLGRSTGAPEYLATVEWLHAWSRRVATWWVQGFDLLLTPVLNGPPPPLRWLLDPVEGTARLDQLLAYTSQWNMTGQPALAVPAALSGQGLPIGVQFVAAVGREDLLVRVGAQWEQARPWDGRRPAVWAG